MNKKQSADLFIDGMLLNVLVGVYPHERKKKQTIVLDITLTLDVSDAMQSDDVADTLNYHAWTQSLTKALEDTSFHLLERLGDFIIKHAESYYPALHKVSLRLKKLNIIENATVAGLHMSRVIH